MRIYLLIKYKILITKYVKIKKRLLKNIYFIYHKFRINFKNKT